jgi:hypothetical protein
VIEAGAADQRRYKLLNVFSSLLQTYYYDVKGRLRLAYPLSLSLSLSTVL